MRKSAPRSKSARTYGTVEMRKSGPAARVCLARRNQLISSLVPIGTSSASPCNPAGSRGPISAVCAHQEIWKSAPAAASAAAAAAAAPSDAKRATSSGSRPAAAGKGAGSGPPADRPPPLEVLSHRDLTDAVTATNAALLAIPSIVEEVRSVPCATHTDSSARPLAPRPAAAGAHRPPPTARARPRPPGRCVCVRLPHTAHCPTHRSIFFFSSSSFGRTSTPTGRKTTTPTSRSPRASSRCLTSADWSSRPSRWTGTGWPARRASSASTAPLPR